MPTTSNRGYSVPITGTEVDTWGGVLNDNFGLIDSNFGTTLILALSNVNVTLSAAQYKNGTIRFTGVLTSNVTIVYPAIQGWWTLDNRTTGNFIVLISCSGAESIAIPQGQAMDICMDGSNIRFCNLPDIGTYADYAGTGVPNWVSACTIPPYLLCDGSSFSAVTYPRLAAVLGGTTLPDTRGRLRATLDGSTSRITTAGSNIDGTTRFAAGGFQNITLDSTMIPAHAHPITDVTHDHSITGGTLAGTASTAFQSGGLTAPGGSSTIDIQPALTGITATQNNTGGGSSHNNMPPTYIGGVTLIRAG